MTAGAQRTGSHNQSNRWAGDRSALLSSAAVRHDHCRPHQPLRQRRSMTTHDATPAATPSTVFTLLFSAPSTSSWHLLAGRSGMGSFLIVTLGLVVRAFLIVALRRIVRALLVMALRRVVGALLIVAQGRIMLLNFALRCAV